MDNKKTAIITGAGVGIGRGIALAFAKAGISVALCDIDLESCQEVSKEAGEFGVKTLAVKCDVSKNSQVEEVFKQELDEFGQIDILVNNAGIYPFVAFEKIFNLFWKV